MPNPFLELLNHRLYRKGGIVHINYNGGVEITANSSYNISLSATSIIVNQGITVQAGNNGQSLTTSSTSELLTITASAATDTSVFIPAEAVVMAVSVRVISAIPSSTTFGVGVNGAATRYGLLVSNAEGVTTAGTNDATRYYGNNTAIRVTPDAVPSSAAGKMRITIHYYSVTPPTS